MRHVNEEEFKKELVHLFAPIVEELMSVGSLPQTKLFTIDGSIKVQIAIKVSAKS